MRHRIQLAALHFNENSSRDQAVTKGGDRRFDIVFPKYKKGGHVVKKVTKDPTYSKSNGDTKTSDVFYMYTQP